MVDDIDTTFVNGVNVGATVGYNLVRKYPVAAGMLKPGRNVVAVRVLDTGGGGGIWGDEKPRLVFKGRFAPTGCDSIAGSLFRRRRPSTFRARGDIGSG